MTLTPIGFGFTGKLNNSDTGISDFGARAYNPLLGRFMQQDPETVHDDKPFTFNRYAYANNNPLFYIDPDGAFGTPNDDDSLNRGIDHAGGANQIGKAFQDLQKSFHNATPEQKRKALGKAAGIGAATAAVLSGNPEAVPGAYKLGEEVEESYLSNTNKSNTSASNEADSAANCFIKDTLVETNGGLKPIQAIAVGDKVTSEDPVSGKISFKPVLQLYHHHHKEILDLTLTDNNGHTQTVGVTPGHRFMDSNVHHWVEAGQLHIGETLVSEHNGSLTVAGIKIDAKKQDTYNFEVKDFHTYFVGNDQAWVHNDCTPTNREMYNSRRAAFRAAKRDAGIPTSQTHITHQSNLKADRLDTRRSATEYDFGEGGRVQTHPNGHSFGDGGSYDTSHFNNHGRGYTGKHYEY